MAFFGKIFGAVAGLATGGPMGALIGAALGHAADKNTLLNPPPGGWAEKWKHKVAPDLTGAATYIAAKFAANTGKKDQLLALCMIILSAKLAKCDGAVNRTEIDAFKRFFAVPKQQQRQVGMLFDQARQRTDDYYKFAEELAHSFKDEKTKLDNVLILLFAIARSDLSPDQKLHPKEEKFLRNIHKIFNLSESAWEYASTGGSVRSQSDEPNAYAILGVNHQASNEEIRAKWLKLVREYHPDALAARNASEKETKVAEIQIVKINAAWDSIKRNRGL